MMVAANKKKVRCAVYTRVSTDAGLDQDFNSLDAQYDAAQAYIRSQAHAGWTLVRTRYDDGGFSGGSTDRPALQQLLADIRADRINVIVVYKVDRLTRSLADFAKLVELFDARGVSFVSVTQQFNTTTSMGRLTLNVLLSFAQFEREVTSERIRDKIGASKRKGLWVGGVVPLGYRAKDRKITVVEDEARTVQHIFRRYLALGSLNLLLADLRTSGIRTKVRPLSNGRTIGGIPFTRGSLAAFLRNRFYIGEVRYRGEIFPGEQPAILDRALFDAVQGKLDQQRINWNKARHDSGSLLTGRIFDERGNRMTPTYAVKKGVRYRYYISAALVQGQPQKAAKLSRVPAVPIEKVIASAVRKHLTSHDQLDSNRPALLADKDLISTHVARVEIQPDHVAIHIQLSIAPEQQSGAWKETARQRCENGNERTQPVGCDSCNHLQTEILRVPWEKPPSKQSREIIPPAASSSRQDRRPIRAETRAKLVTAIASAQYWLNELVTGTLNNIEQIADREKCSTRQINRAMTLAFLAPGLVQAAIEGRLPRGIGVAKLRDLPTEWTEQYERLGLSFPGPVSWASAPGPENLRPETAS
jgi:DNA invertase Pin-like site-specific DNA recombinase